MIRLSCREGAALAPLLKPFFSGGPHLPFAFLDGQMGEGWVDSRTAPRCCVVAVGDFCLLGGEPDRLDDPALLKNPPAPLVIPLSAQWEQAFTACRPDALPICRQQFEAPRISEGKVSREILARTSVPDGFSLAPLDARFFSFCRETPWAADFCSQFSSPEDFAARGLGQLVLFQGTPVAGASSYLIYRDGIEIQVETAPDFRRRGLATAAAASLMRRCFDRGLVPHWDAHNPPSAALAVKLGYTPGARYTAFLTDEILP